MEFAHSLRESLESSRFEWKLELNGTYEFEWERICGKKYRLFGEDPGKETRRQELSKPSTDQYQEALGRMYAIYQNSPGELVDQHSNPVLAMERQGSIRAVPLVENARYQEQSEIRDIILSLGV